MILPRWFPRPYNHLLPLQPTSAAQLLAENWQHCLIAAVKKEEKNTTGVHLTMANFVMHSSCFSLTYGSECRVE